MLAAFNRGRAITGRCMTDRAIEMSFRGYKSVLYPQQALHVAGCVDGGRIVAGEEARLELLRPVPPLGERQARVTRQTALHLEFIELLAVEAAEGCGEPAERANDRKLRRNDVDHETEAGPLNKLQASLGLSLRVDEGLTGQEGDGNRIDTRIRREREITGRIRGFKRVTEQVAG